MARARLALRRNLRSSDLVNVPQKLSLVISCQQTDCSSSSSAIVAPAPPLSLPDTSSWWRAIRGPRNGAYCRNRCVGPFRREGRCYFWPPSNQRRSQSVMADGTKVIIRFSLCKQIAFSAVARSGWLDYIP